MRKKILSQRELFTTTTPKPNLKLAVFAYSLQRVDRMSQDQVQEGAGLWSHQVQPGSDSEHRGAQGSTGLPSLTCKAMLTSFRMLAVNRMFPSYGLCHSCRVLQRGHPRLESPGFLNNWYLKNSAATPLQDDVHTSQGQHTPQTAGMKVR